VLRKKYGLGYREISEMVGLGEQGLRGNVFRFEWAMENGDRLGDREVYRSVDVNSDVMRRGSTKI